MTHGEIIGGGSGRLSAGAGARLMDATVQPGMLKTLEGEVRGACGLTSRGDSEGPVESGIEGKKGWL